MKVLLQKLVHDKGHKMFPVYKLHLVKVKVYIALEQAMKAQRGSRLTAVVFL
jgi:hypothetical protein